MKRFFLSLLIGFVACIGSLQSQMQLQFTNASGDQGTQVSVDVIANNFPALVLFQFSVNWDSTVMRINTITNINSSLPTYSLGSNFGLPASSADVFEGQLTTTWDHPMFSPTTLPAGTRLFTMVFDLVGAPGSSTSVVVSDEPSEREAIIGDFSTNIGVTGNTGTVTINSSGGGNDDLTLTIGQEQAQPNSTVCVPITVQNFDDIESVQFSFTYNTSVLDFTTINSTNLTGIQANESSPGVVSVFWSDSDGNMVTLPDGSIMAELCFTVVGSVGQSSPVTFANMPTAIELFGNGVTYDQSSGNLTLVNGSVTIVDQMQDPVTFNVGTVNGMTGQNVCIPVSVENFNDIVSFAFSITWDASRLRYTGVQSLNLPGLIPGNFNEVTPGQSNNGQLNISWASSSFENITVPDQVIFLICFEVIDCPDGSNTPVRIAKSGITPEVATVINSQPVPVTNTEFNDGSVNCATEVSCAINAIDADCQDNQGNLFVTLMGVTSDCQCQWTGPATQTTTVAQGCNFLNVPPGTYTLRVICNGQEVCSNMATVAPANMIQISSNIRNASCNQLGSITAVPTGGVTPYMYAWSNGGNTETISNLNPGSYTVTVTDNEGCTNSATFQVTDQVEDLSISAVNQTNVTCNAGANGTASVTVTGGCTPYTYMWSRSGSTTAIATGLSAGEVSVTVTDANGSTRMRSFTITQPNPVMINLVSSQAACEGEMDGNITISTTNTTAPVTAIWSNGAQGLSISNLGAGMYTVTVTDANGCTGMGTFTVSSRQCNADCPTVSALLTSDFNGFAISCNGEEDGSIDFSVLSGDLPLTVSLAGPTMRTMTVASLGTVMFEDLRAGNYQINATDASGNNCPLGNVSLSEPQPFTITNVQVGADNNDCDGFIDYTLNGGVGNISCFINDQLDSDCDFGDLCAGNYVIRFVDANGCAVERMERVRTNTGGPDVDCYEATLVLTPNNDGANDFFDITCLDDFPVDLQVYDRWGRLVFEQDNYDGSWAGTNLAGSDLPEASYMFVIQVNLDRGVPQIFKGTLTLLR